MLTPTDSISLLINVLGRETRKGIIQVFTSTQWEIQGIFSKNTITSMVQFEGVRTEFAIM